MYSCIRSVCTSGVCHVVMYSIAIERVPEFWPPGQTQPFHLSCISHWRR